MRQHRSIWLALAFTIALSGSLPAAETVADDAGNELFEKKVRPLLVQYCYACHSARVKKLKGGLLLDSREALLRGGENGPAIVPGQPEKSRLVRAIRYQDVDLQMPPKGKLPAAAIADLATWVQRGGLGLESTIRPPQAWFLSPSTSTNANANIGPGNPFIHRTPPLS